MRQKLISCIVLGCFAVLLCVPGLSVPPQPAQNSSNSNVTAQATRVLADFYNRCKSGTATTGDIQSAATAVRMLSASWEDSGVNASLQSDISRMAAASASFSGASDQQVNSLYAQLRGFGASVTPADVREFLTIPQDDVNTFMQKYNRPGGIEALESQVVSTLTSAALNARNGGGTAHLALASFRSSSAVFISPETCFGLRAGAFYLGIVSLACPLCAGVPGIIGLGLAGTALLLC